MNDIAPHRPPCPCIRYNGESERSEHNREQGELSRENKGCEKEDEIDKKRSPRSRVEPMPHEMWFCCHTISLFYRTGVPHVVNDLCDDA
jgi:hypothetical protein